MEKLKVYLISFSVLLLTGGIVAYAFHKLADGNKKAIESLTQEKNQKIEGYKNLGNGVIVFENAAFPELLKKFKARNPNLTVTAIVVWGDTIVVNAEPKTAINAMEGCEKASTQSEIKEKSIINEGR